MVLGEYCFVARHIGFGGKADAGDVGIDPCRTFVHSPLLSDTGQYIFLYRALAEEGRWRGVAGRCRTSAARAFCRQ